MQHRAILQKVVLGVGLVLALSRCSGDAERPSRPGFEDRPDSGSDSGLDASAEADAAPDGRDADIERDAETSDGGDAGDAAQVEDSGTSDADIVPDGGSDGGGESAECVLTSSWTSGERLTISSAEDDVFGSISQSGLTIAWRSEPSGRYHYADRETTATAFGAAQTIPAIYGAFAADRAALSPDGLRLVLVTADRKGFVELRRTARGAAFGEPDPTPFDFLTDFGEAAGEGDAFGDPVIANGDRDFVYSFYGNDRTHTVLMSTRLFAGDRWPSADVLVNDARLAVTGAGRVRPTAMTLYNGILFYWSEADSTQRAAVFDWESFSIERVIELPGRQFAAPTQDCSEIYYTAPGDGGLDLYRASRL